MVVVLWGEAAHLRWGGRFHGIPQLSHLAEDVAVFNIRTNVVSVVKTAYVPPVWSICSRDGCGLLLVCLCDVLTVGRDRSLNAICSSACLDDWTNTFISPSACFRWSSAVFVAAVLICQNDSFIWVFFSIKLFVFLILHWPVAHHRRHYRILVKWDALCMFKARLAELLPASEGKKFTRAKIN